MIWREVPKTSMGIVFYQVSSMGNYVQGGAGTHIYLCSLSLVDNTVIVTKK